MVYTVLSCLAIALELVIIATLVIAKIKGKQIISLESAIYVAPTFLIMYALNCMGIIHDCLAAGETPTFFIFVDAISVSYELFTASVDTAFVDALINTNVVFSIAYFIGFILSLLTFITVLIAAIAFVFRNASKQKRLLSSGCDILIGKSDDNAAYMQNYPNALIWADDTYSYADKKQLFDDKIVHLKKPFTESELAKTLSYSLKHGKRFNFIALGDENDNLRYVAIFKRFLATAKTENCFLNVKLNYTNYLTINDKILSDTDHVAYINCFNKYDLIARKFVEVHPVTRYLNSDFINYDKACLKENVDVKVTFLGFGKIAKAIYRNSVMNDQIPQLCGDTIKPYVINYVAYERVVKGNEQQNSQFYDDRYNNARAEMQDGDYFPLPDKISHFTFVNKDVNHLDCFNELNANLFTKQHTFNQIIVSCGDDADNINLAINLVSLFNQKDNQNYHLFVRVKSYRDEYKDFFVGDKVSFFGYDNFIINHDVLVDEALATKAAAIKGSYTDKCSKLIRWTKEPSIKKLSNVYAGINARLKLNLLGYDATFGVSTSDDLRLLKEISDKLSIGAPSKDTPYDDYLFWNNDDFYPVNALAYQEKLRWNAYYVMNGYAPMKKRDIRVDDGVIYKDDDVKKLHACITTVRGLDEYHKFIATRFANQSDENYESILNDVQTYKYDYSFAYVINSYIANQNVNVIKKD